MLSLIDCERNIVFNVKYMFINMPYSKIIQVGPHRKAENTILGWQASSGVKMLATKPDNLHSIPGTQAVEKEKQFL